MGFILTSGDRSVGSAVESVAWLVLAAVFKTVGTAERSGGFNSLPLRL